MTKGRDENRIKVFMFFNGRQIAHRFNVSGKKRQQKAPAKLKTPRIKDGMALKKVAYKSGSESYFNWKTVTQSHFFIVYLRTV